MDELGAPDGRAWRYARLFMSRVYHWQPSEIDKMDAVEFIADFKLALEMIPK